MIGSIEAQTTDFDTALKRIVQTCDNDSLLAKGLHEVCRAIEVKNEELKAKYVILAKNCTDQNYTKIVRGLANRNKIPIIEIDEGETLGEFLGFCKYDKNKSVIKKRKCSSVAILAFSYEAREEEKKIFLSKVS
jgi:small subunit ribosomal protein S12e